MAVELHTTGAIKLILAILSLQLLITAASTETEVCNTEDETGLMQSKLPKRERRETEENKLKRNSDSDPIDILVYNASLGQSVRSLGANVSHIVMQNEIADHSNPTHASASTFLYDVSYHTSNDYGKWLFARGCTCFASRDSNQNRAYSSVIYRSEANADYTDGMKVARSIGADFFYTVKTSQPNIDRYAFFNINLAGSSAQPHVNDPDNGCTLECATDQETCWKSAFKWEPLDMPGQANSVEASVFLCQDRCKKASGCQRFTYFTRTQSCHLQDSSAQEAPATDEDVVSGLKACRTEGGLWIRDSSKDDAAFWMNDRDRGHMREKIQNALSTCNDYLNHAILREAFVTYFKELAKQRKKEMMVGMITSGIFFPLGMALSTQAVTGLFQKILTNPRFLNQLEAGGMVGSKLAEILKSAFESIIEKPWMLDMYKFHAHAMVSSTTSSMLNEAESNVIDAIDFSSKFLEMHTRANQVIYDQCKFLPPVSLVTVFANFDSTMEDSKCTVQEQQNMLSTSKFNYNAIMAFGKKTECDGSMECYYTDVYGMCEEGDRHRYGVRAEALYRGTYWVSCGLIDGQWRELAREEAQKGINRRRVSYKFRRGYNFGGCAREPAHCYASEHCSSRRRFWTGRRRGYSCCEDGGPDILNDKCPK